MEGLIVYLAGLALVAVASWMVAWPFVAAMPRAAASPEPADAGRSAWERRKDEALAAIRDAEFDHQLGKLSDADYRDLRGRLERTAVDAIHALDRRGDNR
jgi:hypothetical protein